MQAAVGCLAVFVRFLCGLGQDLGGKSGVKAGCQRAPRLDSRRGDGYNKDRKRRCDKRLALLMRYLDKTKNRHRPGWRFLLFTTKLSVTVL